jgi:hypothetical protein
LSTGGSRYTATGATGATATAVPTNVPQTTNKNAASLLVFNVNAPVQFDEQLMIASPDSDGC